MAKISQTFSQSFIAVWLFSLLSLCVQSCNDNGVKLEKQKVQFTFSTGTTSNGRVKETELPDNVRLRISIESSSGASIFSNHEVEVLKAGSSYIADPLELLPGAYVLTDFMLVKDGEVLYATPKGESHLSSFVTHALPHNFSVTENAVANVSMQVIDVRHEEPEAYGYASFKVNIVNTLPISVFRTEGGQTSLTDAVAELHQGKKLVKTFSLKAGVNAIAFEGDPDAVYTLTVYTDKEANTKTFNFKELKKELGNSALKLTLQPALFLTIDSSVEEGNENEDYFDLGIEGTGTLNINWGDGHQQSATLPFEISHEYTSGTYTAIVTGDVHEITNFFGFSYGSIISAITGLTNLTALKTYNPSWGAVPIKVDLSNCKKLETIYVEKYGAPYEPVDLRTDFKLPEQHFIKEFVFYAPSFDDTRENISAEELEVFVDNIYNNVLHRSIYNGRFLVYPVVASTPETQDKLDALQHSYNWEIELDGELYEEDSEGGRIRTNLEARRENWLRQKFPNNQRLKRNAKIDFVK